MFDDDVVRSRVDQAAPFQRGLVATLCLNRASALARDERVDRAVEGFRRLVEDTVAFCRALALGGVAGAEGTDSADGADAEALGTRFRAVLGPDDLPYDEPEGLAAWLVDVVSIADYAVRTWSEPEESGSRCFDVLVSCYSLAGMLEDEPEAPSPEALAELEVARQLADLQAVTGFSGHVAPDELEALLAESAALRTLYGRRFEDVLGRD
jgi:hypothetical protein